MILQGSLTALLIKKGGIILSGGNAVWYIDKSQIHHTFGGGGGLSTSLIASGGKHPNIHS